MHWPEIAALAHRLRQPADIKVRQLHRADVAQVIEQLGAWHPELLSGDDSELLTVTFYQQEVALAKEEQAIASRPAYVLLLEFKASPVAYLLLEYELEERALFVRLAVVAPRERGRGLGRFLLELDAAIAQALDAKVSYGFVELDNRAQCAALEGAGRVLCGILPGCGKKGEAPSAVRYVPKAIYAKLLISPEQLIWPDLKALRPETAALMKLLFQFGDLSEPPKKAAQPVVPALPPDVAAALAARPKGTWPDMRLLARFLTLPPQVSVRQLARGDISTLLLQLPVWHPSIAEGSQSRLLTRDFYEELVALAGEDQSVERRPIHARVFLHKGELIGLNYSICEHKRSTLRAEFIVIDPQKRGLGLVLSLLPLKVLLGRALGIRSVLAWATLSNPYRQMAAERSGFQLLGIVPAADERPFSQQATKYTFEALYGLSLVPPEEVACPPRAAMSPRVAALADFVLGCAVS